MNMLPKKGTVYVVDDDEAVRDSLQWLLEGQDYRVRCFDSAENFLARYDNRDRACGQRFRQNPPASAGEFFHSGHRGGGARSVWRVAAESTRGRSCRVTVTMAEAAVLPAAS